MQILFQYIYSAFERIADFSDQQKIILLGLICGLLIAIFLYPLLRILVTLLHEFGHALAAKITFGKVYRIHLNHDSSGLTQTSGGGRSFFVLLMGYPTPLLFGCLFSWFLIINHPEFILISLLIVSLSVLIVVKNWYGFLICLLGILMTGALLYFGQIQIFNFIGGALIGFLTLGSFIDLKVIFHKNEELSDADLLHEKFQIIPAFVWKLIFLLMMSSCLFLIIITFKTLLFK
ncbi:hypothetical protein LMG8526HA_02035 [Lactococcus lactis]|uniref:M50 family metallopeptidase n=1 Tax=Lactococcus lactis TaxID=1358 RepID=UPI0028FD5E71|nr:M50 family metallopeptidase [Lactococcus lactis]MDU0401149.1 hypothetical protein [Lactococcus lactis]